MPAHLQCRTSHDGLGACHRATHVEPSPAAALGALEGHMLQHAACLGPPPPQPSAAPRMRGLGLRDWAPCLPSTSHSPPTCGPSCPVISRLRQATRRGGGREPGPGACRDSSAVRRGPVQLGEAAAVPLAHPPSGRTGQDWRGAGGWGLLLEHPISSLSAPTSPTAWGPE